jgi:hypothetical protein
MTVADLHAIAVLGQRPARAVSDDYRGDIATPAGVRVGGSITGNIDFAGDTDWFRVALTAGYTYLFLLQGFNSGHGTLPDTFLTLGDSAGGLVASDDGAGLESGITYTPTASGTYYLSVAGDAGALGTYQLLADVVGGPDDYAGDTSTTGQVGVGGSVTGNIDFLEDRDWFRVTLAAGYTYRFDLQGRSSGHGTLPDPILSLRNSLGGTLASDEDSGIGPDAQITYTAISSGTYYLSASGGTISTGASTGTYLLSVSETTFSGLVAIGDAAISEGNGGTRLLTFTVTRSGGTAAFTVDYATADGTATAGQDYVAASGTLQFGATETTKTVSVTINGDTTVEPNEYFYVNLSNATSGAAIGDGQGVGTILNDDATPFDAAALRLAAFSYGAGGWVSQDTYPRRLADVTGDGRADIVGFAEDGAYVALATGGGNFAAPILGSANFGVSSAAGGWISQDTYPRELADVTGDGKADIVGFGAAGAYVAAAVGGGNFAAPIPGLANFGAGAAGGGWYSDDRYPRALADVNGDGRADIVGFAEDGAYVALATGGGNFAAPILGSANFGVSSAAGGWTGQDTFPRLLADIDGDGKADIAGFGYGGVAVALSHDTLAALAAP